MIKRLRGLLALPFAFIGVIFLLIAIKINPAIANTFMRVTIDKFEELGIFDL